MQGLRGVNRTECALSTLEPDLQITSLAATIITTISTAHFRSYSAEGVLTEVPIPKHHSAILHSRRYSSNYNCKYHSEDLIKASKPI